MKNNVVVLGAGIAGISATYHAKLKDLDVAAYEASAKPGGLVANFEIAGFRFDNAVHFSFTKDQYVRSIFDKTPYIIHEPNAYCLDRGVWLKHPVQNNLYPLRLEEKVSCIKSFVNRPTKEPVNYGEWLTYQYGTEIAEKYPVPYTKKYWGLSPAELSLSWVGKRMRQADLTEILAGVLESRDDNHYYANEMRYPEKGGYFQFISEIVDQVDILCDHRAEKIDCRSKQVYFSSGKVVNYETLVSSLPLPVICELIENCPSDVLAAARSLLWTTVDLISVGFNISKVPPYLWFYIYDGDNLAARAYSPSWKSKDNAPEGKSSLQFEIYNLSSKKRLNKDDLILNIKSKLIEMNICNEENIEFLHHKHLPFGNVVFDHGMEERRKIILDYLGRLGIKTCGRFGEWDYLWSDQSFLSGMEVIEKL